VKARSTLLRSASSTDVLCQGMCFIPIFIPIHRLIYNRNSRSFGPTDVFTSDEIAIWKNFAAWKKSASWINGDWVDLPGPASWWGDDNSIDATGFRFSTISAGAHKAAWEIVRAPELPADNSYDRIAPSHSDLWLMDDTMATRVAVEAFLQFETSI
jgi:hypothetical protein